MKFKFLLICFLFLINGCVSSNLYVYSTKNSEYNFNKTENIFVKIRNKPTEEIQKLVEFLESSLVDYGFIVVDSLYKADRTIEILFNDSTYLYQAHIKNNFFRDIPNLFEKPYFDFYDTNHNPSYATCKNGYSDLRLIMIDSNIKSPKYQSFIWYSGVLTPTEEIKNNPEIAIKLILKQYGSDEMYYSTFPDK